MTVTSTDIANRAIQLIGDNQPEVTGVSPTFDDSTAGKALQILYAPCVARVQRLFEWDASRNTVALTLTANTPPFPWLYEYRYPTNGIQVWQLLPASVSDPFNPLPQNWNVANALVNGTQTKVIHTDLINAKAVYNNNPSEDTWDADFADAVVRNLASDLAMALFGKPDTSQGLMQAGMGMVQIAQTRDS
jgi:hypothetical protein